MSQALLETYAHTFAELTPETVDQLCTLVSEQVHFRDPFNDIHGPDALKHLLQDMFARAGRPRFEVKDIVWHEHSGTGWLGWYFSTELPVIGLLQVEGCSRITFDNEGRVQEHLDYWDSAPIYLQLPFIGRLLRRIRHRISSQS